MSRRSLSASASENATGRRVGLDEVRPLVADHRRAGRARGEDLVGERPVDPVALGEDEALGDGAVEPEDQGVDRELHGRARSRAARGGRPVAARRSRIGRARSRSSASPPTMIVSSPASVERDAARDRARRGSRRRVPGRPARPRGSCRAGRCSCRPRPSPPGCPAATPSGPSNSVAHRRVVRDHRDDDVGPRRGLGRRGRHARADPLGQRGRPAPASGCRRRPSTPWPGQPLGHRRAHPARAEDGGGRGGHRQRLPALTRRRPSAAGRSRRSARPTARRGPRAPPPTAAGCAGS